MRRVLRVIVRFSVVGALETLSLLAVDWLVPGITLVSLESGGTLVAAVSAASVLAIVNTLLRPVLILLTLPLNVLTLGFSTLFANGAVLLLTGYLLPYFVLDGWVAALWATLILSAVNTLLTSLTTIDDDYSFFDGVVQWLSKHLQVSSVTSPGRGLVILEIDGLSYPRFQRAVEQGLMPTVGAMLHDGTHALSRYDCGLPSQTSSCQAGIMYGDNFDIPAFRWYEKDRGKLMVSSHFEDAAEMNARYARGQGLLRGGSSICNHMAGDAKKTLFTMSVLTDRPEDIERRSLEDLYLFWLNPYVFTRTVVLALWDVLVELGQGMRQRILNVRPRVNRLQNGYPLLRAIANVFLRDLATFVVVMDVIRGIPAIYASYVGYDKIAHHSGPDTPDALNTLRMLDTQVRRILDVIRRKAPRRYDLILLSDHGQSMGATFEQRYGHTLTEFIEGLVEGETTVAEVIASENSQGHTAALLAEIEGMGQNVALGRVRGATLGRARKALQNRLKHDGPPAAVDAQPAGVIVCVSGNLANVYSDLSTEKVSVQELNKAYPGLVDALVAHPGVGFVVAHVADGGRTTDGPSSLDGAPWVLGKNGARHLLTGAVRGSDPLALYGDASHRAAQLLRLAQFPHAGDLIVNGTLYEHGRVAAFEELVGSHGGLGGQQTDAFLLHPVDMVVPSTSNATDVFALLNARRGLPDEPIRPRKVIPTRDPWALRTLVGGVRDVHTWISRAERR